MVTRQRLHSHAVTGTCVHPAESCRSPVASDDYIVSLLPNLNVKAKRVKTVRLLREVDQTKMHHAMVNNECKHLNTLVRCIPQASSEDDIFFTLDLVELLLTADLTTEHLCHLPRNHCFKQLQYDQGPLGAAVCLLLRYEPSSSAFTTLTNTYAEMSVCLRSHSRCAD